MRLDGRFDSDTAHDRSTSTFAPLSDTGNRPPRVHFTVSPTDNDSVMTADPPGARIYCELDTDGTSRVRIADIRRSGDLKQIADITVREIDEGTITDETIAIASAIYWSWWRARDMNGEAP